MQEKNAAKSAKERLLNIASIKSKTGLVSVTLLSGLMLSGCSLTTEKSTENEAATQSQSEKVVKTNNQPATKLEPSINMDSQTMFEVMAAELLLKRKQPQAAFNTLYKVAQRYQNAELAERAFQMAMMTYNEESIEKATTLWKNISPDSDVAWRAAFILSLRNDKLDQALQEFETYQSLSATNLQTDLIAAANKVGSAVSAARGIAFFKALTVRYSQEWSAFYALGMVSTIYKEAETGIEALTTAQQMMQEEETQGADALIFNLLSKLYLSVEPASRGVEAIRPYVERKPDDLLVQERLARLEVQAQLYDAAAQRYELIVAKEPQAHTSRFSLALLQMEREQYQAAEQNLLKVSKEKGYQSVAFYYLGILHQEQEQFDKALAYFAQVKAEGYRLDATLHSSEIVFNQGEKQQALRMLNDVEIKTDVDRIKVLRAKAIFLTSEDKYAEAAKLYDEVLALQPNNIHVLKAQSLLFYSLKQFTEYENALLTALKINPDDSEVLNALGYFYVENNMKLDTAFVLLQRALSIEPESYFILDSMGWYYYQRGEYEQSLEYLHKAFAKAKDDEVLVHLVSAYWAKGEQSEARNLWHKYREKFQGNRKVQNLINDLEQGKTP